MAYKLTILDQCQPGNGIPIVLPAQTETSLTITDLLSYSTYEISVTSDTWPPCLQNEAAITQSTEESRKFIMIVLLLSLIYFFHKIFMVLKIIQSESKKNGHFRKENIKNNC